ncbi:MULTISPECIES: hypothetical protein [unclassified Maribacter]|uniref:hypothetical protein n=1 Tax=unclassified Maribacter TaxID=2615042 RepID=UPI00257F7251|nr:MULTISPECIES: hypothetical protein [unclassified Maribacter]|tara:strand:- start:113177 stop:115243 length:2067 start_codon:yes stop_codon:yes gene_type:complete
MKNTYKLIFLLTFLTVFSFNSKAQYKQTPLQEVSFDRYGDPISSTDGETYSEEPFKFKITFSDMNVLLDMQNAMAAYNRAKVDEWMRKQENNFKNEINRQLGTNYSNFKDAQRSFYKEYEIGVNKIDVELRDLVSDYSAASNRLSREQQEFTNELKILGDWKSIRNDCNPIGIIDCGSISQEVVKGVKMRNASLSVLNQLENESLDNFSNHEYDAALHIAWAQGIQNTLSTQSVIAEMAENHMNFYERKSLEDKIFYMTTYLIQYQNRNMSASPLSPTITKYNPPIYWNKSILLEKGKLVAPVPPKKALVFKPGYISRSYDACLIRREGTYYCRIEEQKLYDLKQEIIEEHIKNLYLSEEFLKQKKPDYFKQIVTNPNSGSSRIHENAFTIQNSKNQTIAFVTPDEKFFFWNGIVGSYSKSEIGNNYRDTYMYYVEDKYRRQSEPISWGVYLAADDLGGFYLDLIDSPNQTVSNFANGIGKIITLDFDINKTWQAIVDADLTDVSYISATLALGHLAGPKGVGVIPASETGQLQQFLARYASKSSPAKLTWPQLFELFRKARAFEKAVSNHLASLYSKVNGYKVFSQVYVKVDGAISIVDDLIYNTTTRKWILNETKYGVGNTLSRNQEIIQNAIKNGKKIEIRSKEALIPGQIGQGSYITISEILRSHSINGSIIFDTVKSTWKSQK